MKYIKQLFLVILAFSTFPLLSQLSISIDSVQESRCVASGIAYSNPNGGTPPYLFRWKVQGAPNSTYSLPQSDSTILGLGSGNWTIQVIDDLSATSTVDVTIPGNYQDPILIIDSVIDEECVGTGAIYARDSLGRGPYQYLLRDGGLAGPIIRPLQDSGAFLNINAGTYTVQSFDSCGVLKSIININVNYAAGSELRYDNYFNVGGNYYEYATMHMYPTTCFEGTIGVYSTYNTGSIYDSNRNELDGTDTLQPAITLIGGKLPYLYELKEVNLVGLAHEFTTNSGTSYSGTNVPHYFDIESTKDQMLLTTFLQSQSSSSPVEVVFYLKDTFDVLIDSTPHYTVDGYQEIALNWFIQANTPYRIEWRKISGGTIRSSLVPPQTFPLTIDNITFNKMVANGSVTDRFLPLYELTFSDTGNILIDTSTSAPLFHGIDRSSDLMISATDACGTEINLYWRKEPINPLDSLKLNRFASGCNSSFFTSNPCASGCGQRGQMGINNYYDGGTTYRGVPSYTLEVVSGAGLLPPPVLLDFEDLGYFNSNFVWPNWEPVQNSTYRLRLTDACGNSIERDLPPVTVNDFTTMSPVTVSSGFQRGLACPGYVTMRASRGSNQENVSYLLTPLTPGSYVQNNAFTGTSSAQQLIFYLSEGGVFELTVTGLCSGNTYKDTVTVPDRYDSSWVQAAQPSCVSFVGGGSAIIGYDLLIDTTHYSIQAHLYNESGTSLGRRSASLASPAVFTNLGPGTYTVRFGGNSSPLDCYGSQTFTLYEYIQPQLELNFDPVCAPSTTGNIYTTPKYGHAPFTFEIKESAEPVDSFSNPQASQVFANMPINTYDVRVIDSCGNSTINTITTGIMPSPIINAPDTLCENSTLTISTGYIPNVTYTWYKDGVLLPYTSHLFHIPNASSSDEGIYKVVTSSAPCIPDSSQKQVYVRPSPISAFANPDMTKYCEGETVTLSAGNNSSYIAGTWTFIEGPDSILPPFLGNPPPSFETTNPLVLSHLTTTDSIDQNGSIPYRYRWTINTGTCEANADAVFEIFRTPTTAFAGADILLCAETNTQLLATPPVFWKGHWTQTSGPSVTITDTTNSNTTITGLVPGNDYSFRWYAYNDTNGQCQLFDNMTVFNPLPTHIPDAGPDTALCNSYTYQMQANSIPSNAGIGQWILHTAPVGATTPTGYTSFFDRNDPNTTITFYDGGTYEFIWAVFNGACLPEYDTVAITVAVANAGFDQSYCITDLTNTRLAADTVKGFNGAWSQVTGPTSAIITPSSGAGADTAFISNLDIGIYSFEWDINSTISGFVCNLQDTVLVYINDSTDQANAGSDTSVCTNAIVLNGNVPSSGNPDWQYISGPMTYPTFSNYDSSYTEFIPIDTGTYTFVYRIENAPCATTYDTVLITVTGIPPGVNLTSIQNITCDSLNSGAINVQGTGGNGNYEYSLNNGPFQLSGSYTGLVAGTYSIAVRDLTASSCYDSVSVTLIGNDTVAPQITCIDTTIYLNTGTFLFDSTSLIDTIIEACSVDSIAYSISGYNFTCSDTGNYTITIKVWDAAGNVDSCLSTLTVLDTASPIIICNDTSLYLSSIGTYTLDTSILITSLGDNCGIDSVYANFTPLSYDCSDIGNQTIVITAWDINGNQSTCNSTLTIADTSAPMITCMDSTVVLDINGNISIDTSYVLTNLSDNCGIDTVYFTSSTSYTCGSNTTQTVTVIARDFAGNIDSCSSTITLIDTVMPTVSCFDTTLSITTDSVTIDTSFIIDQLFDNCSIDSIGFSTSDFTFNCSDIGTHPIWIYVWDNYNNIDSCLANVTVTNTAGPTIVCNDTTVFLDNFGNYVIDTSLLIDQLSSNCNGIDSVYANFSSLSYDCSDIGTQTITVTAWDMNNNSTSCTSVLTVMDSIAPSISCQNTSVYIDANGTIILDTNGIINSLTDNCSIDTVYFSNNTTPLNCTNNSAQTVTIIAVDASGNIDSCSSSIVILDTVVPTLVCKDTTVDVTNGNVTIDTSFVISQLFDNCGIDSIGYSTSNLTFGCADAGSHSITVYAWDYLGNVDSCNTTVTVVGGSNLTCNDTAIYIDYTNITLNPNDYLPVNGCGIDSIWLSKVNFSCDDLGQNTVTTYIRNTNSSIDSCSFTLTIIDTVSPQVICPSFTYTTQLVGSCEYIVPSFIDSVVLLDNCSDSSMLTYTQSPNEGDVISLMSPAGDSTKEIYQITVTATDSSGNSSSCDIRVEITCNGLIIPSFSSPNGDGMNDQWVIEGIESYPNNSLKIYNRWGSLVYQKKNYDNTWPNISFDEIEGMKIEDKQSPGVPDGTYYYMLDLGEGTEIIQGFVIVLR